MKLSILVCSIHSRAALLKRLLAVLAPQESPEAELLVYVDDGEVSIGSKRNALLADAKGDYLCFVDDDDLVPADYAARILRATELSPDVVGFRVERRVNGIYDGMATHTLRYRSYATTLDEFGHKHYERTPNHLNPVRAEIARAARFPDLNNGEDSDYAKRIYPHLKTEVFIPRVLYLYLYVDLALRNERTNVERRLGIDPETWFNEHAKES